MAGGDGTRELVPHWSPEDETPADRLGVVPLPVRGDRGRPRFAASTSSSSMTGPAPKASTSTSRAVRSPHCRSSSASATGPTGGSRSVSPGSSSTATITFAVIAPDTAELYLDEAKVIESPARGPGRRRPACLRAAQLGERTGRLGRQRLPVTVTLTRGGSEVERRESVFGDPRPTPLLLFQPDQPTTTALATLPGDTVTVDVWMRFSRSDPDPWKPFIDEFEQCRSAAWPEKVTGAADLVSDIAAEDAVLATMPPSSDYDGYGGYLGVGWSEPATGFFRVVQRNGFWWLITPDGNPCFYLGVSVFPAQAWDMTGVTGRESLFASLPAVGQPSASAWSCDVWGTGENMDYFSF